MKSIKLTTRALSLAVTLSFALTGCAQQSGQPGFLGSGQTGSVAGTGMGGGELAGTLGGAALGGLAGNQIGRGSGQAIATGLGVVLGGFVGNRIGNALDKGSIAYNNQQTQRALETSQPGQALPWQSPSNPQVSGVITPQAVYQNPQGLYCREYTQKINIGGQQQTAVGHACRNPDGTWTPVNS